MMFVLVLIILVIKCTVMGIVTKEINEDRGFCGGFAWGCWLGVAGIIIVACRPSPLNYRCEKSEQEKQKEEHMEKRLLDDGGWRCAFCGRVNADYVTTCVCGKTPSESKVKENEALVLEHDYWKCTGCGRVNPPLVMTCFCGVKKAESKAKEMIQK